MNEVEFGGIQQGDTNRNNMWIWWLVIGAGTIGTLLITVSIYSAVKKRRV